MDELTPEELQAILGTDYETTLADVLRRKGKADDRAHGAGDQPLGQMANGHVFFDPGTAFANWNNRRKAANDLKGTDAEMKGILDRQTAGRNTFAQALLRKPPSPPVAPPPGARPPMPPQGAPMPPSVPPSAPPAPPAAPPPQAPQAPSPAAPPALGPALADPGPRGFQRPMPTDMSDRINRNGPSNEISYLINLLRNRG